MAPAVNRQLQKLFKTKPPSNESEQDSEMEDSREESTSETRETSEDDMQDPELSNLTLPQLEKLQMQNENDIEEVKNRIAVLVSKIDAIDSQKCRAELTEEETRRLKSKQSKLMEEESYLKSLEQRSKVLKRTKPKFRPFPVDKLPRVIICSRWDDGMPKVAVASMPQQTVPRNKTKLNQEFQEVFTKEQMEMIENEQRWMALTCGEIEMQIAGLKGELRVISNENNVLKAIVEQQEPNDIAPVGGTNNNKPCKGRKGKPGKTVPCHELNSRDQQQQLAITISSTAINPDTLLPDDHNAELEYIDKNVEELKNSLNNAQKIADTLKSQRDALRCLKLSLE